MNKYGRLMLDQHLATTGETPSPDLKDRFERLGEGIQHSITSLRDEILGPQRWDEDLNEYRIRSHQVHRKAEEAVMARLLETFTSPDEDSESEELTSSAADLALISDQLSQLDADWTETAP